MMVADSRPCSSLGQPHKDSGCARHISAAAVVVAAVGIQNAARA